MVNLNFFKSEVVNPTSQKGESQEGVKTFNINDLDILEKLANIAGCKIEDISNTEFIERKENAKKKEGSEWYIVKAGVKFYMEGDGNIHLISNKDNKGAKDRAQAMGMKVME